MGIDEKDGYTVTGVYDPQDLQTKATQQALPMEPIVRTIFTVTDYNGKKSFPLKYLRWIPTINPAFISGGKITRFVYSSWRFG